MDGLNVSISKLEDKQRGSQMNNPCLDSKESLNRYSKIFFPKAKAMVSRGGETSIETVMKMDLIRQDTLNTVMEVTLPRNMKLTDQSII